MMDINRNSGYIEPFKPTPMQAPVNILSAMSAQGTDLLSLALETDTANKKKASKPADSTSKPGELEEGMFKGFQDMADKLNAKADELGNTLEAESAKAFEYLATMAKALF